MLKRCASTSWSRSANWAPMGSIRLLHCFSNHGRSAPPFPGLHRCRRPKTTAKPWSPSQTRCIVPSQAGAGPSTGTVVRPATSCLQLPTHVVGRRPPGFTLSRHTTPVVGRAAIPHSPPAPTPGALPAAARPAGPALPRSRAPAYELRPRARITHSKTREQGAPR